MSPARPEHPAAELPGNPADLVESLTAYDERLRLGLPTDVAEESTVVDPPDREIKPLYECLDLLEAAWPRRWRFDHGELPKQIGRFQLQGVLGIGGFGIVYKAYDPRLRRPVALKVPRLHSLATPSLRARFQREARAAAALDHPNIVPIHEVGEEGATCYIVSAYCDGPNLAEWLQARNEPIPVRTVAELASRLAAAVHYSHAHGVLHRDLKPSNVLLAKDDHDSSSEGLPFVPRVSDFGLAKVLEEDSNESTSMALGTPAYMAPEQAGVGSSLIGPQADVYGLGAMLYELLAGRPPFPGATIADVIDQLRHSEPVPPRRLRREIPRDLETIVLNAIEKNPADRYATADELAADLRRFLEDRPITAHRPTAWDRLRKWARRHRRPLAAAALILIIATIGTALAGWQIAAAEARAAWERANAAEQLRQTLAKQIEVDQQKQLADQKQQLADVRLAQIRQSRYVAQINLAAVAWKRGKLDSAREFLASCVPQPGEPDLRGFEWRLLARACRERPVWNRHQGEVYFARFSPDGKRVASAGQDGVRIWAWETEGAWKRGDQVAHLTAHQNDVNAIGWSPDGRWLASASDDQTVRIWDTQSWQTVAVLEHARYVCAAVFSPDGKLLATAERQPRPERDGVSGDEALVRLWDPLTWQSIGELPDPAPGALQGLEFSPNGNLLATAGRGNSAVLWDVATRTIRHRLEHPDQAVVCVAFAKDHPLLLTAGTAVGVWSIDDGSLKHTLTQPVQAIESIAFAPNGRSFVTAGRAGDVVVREMGHFDHPSTHSAHRFRQQSGVWCAVYAPDNETVLTTGVDGALRLARPMEEPFDHHRIWNDIGPSLTPSQMEFSPDGRWIVLGGSPSARIIDRQKDLFRPYHHGSGVSVLGGAPHVSHFLFRSKDGRLVTADPFGHVVVHTLPPSSPEVVKPVLNGYFPRDTLRLMEFPDSGDLLAIDRRRDGSPDTCWRLSIDRRELTEVDWLEGVVICSFAPDGRLVAAFAHENELRLHDASSGEILARTPHQNLMSMTWSHDGQRLAVATEDGTIELRNAPTLEREFVWAGDPHAVVSLAFSTDDRTLAGVLSGGRLRLWNVASGMELMTLEVGPIRLEQVQFSPDGTMLGAVGRVEQLPLHELLLWRAEREGDESR